MLDNRLILFNATSLDSFDMKFDTWEVPFPLRSLRSGKKLRDDEESRLVYMSQELSCHPEELVEVMLILQATQSEE